MRNIPSHTKLVLALLVFLPLYFIVAAFGTKIGLWGYETGLGTLTFQAGLWVLGIVAIGAIISLIIALIKKPRNRLSMVIAVFGIVLPGIFMVQFNATRKIAAQNPIHDVSTDTATPPSFSPQTVTVRNEEEANPLLNYQIPLGDTEMFANSAPELKIKSQAQIINDTYAYLSPLPLGGASKADAVAAVAAAMGAMGLNNIRTDVEAGRVEGMAETFWFGFKDDVVARVGDSEIDFRSVSRVGRSDLGANAKRIAELRSRVAEQIGQR